MKGGILTGDYGVAAAEKCRQKHSCDCVRILGELSSAINTLPPLFLLDLSILSASWLTFTLVRWAFCETESVPYPAHLFLERAVYVVHVFGC